MAFTYQPALQVRPGVDAAGEGAERDALGGRDIRQVLQPLQRRRRKLGTNLEIERRQRVVGEGRETPPVHEDQPVARLAWIGGEASEDRHLLVGSGGLLVRWHRGGLYAEMLLHLRFHLGGEVGVVLEIELRVLAPL